MSYTCQRFDIPDVGPFGICEVKMNLDARLNAADSARVAGVSKQLFNYWRKTGKVASTKVLPNGRPLYLLRDVLNVEAQTADSPHSSRT